MSSKPYRHFIALLLVLFCSRFEAQAEDLFAKTDSTLQQYLIRCKAQIKDPDFLQTNDTLTRMAQEKNDKRMQVIAVVQTGLLLLSKQSGQYPCHGRAREENQPKE